MIRTATLQDLDFLQNLEQRCFTTDILSRRNFLYLLTKASAHTLVDEKKGTLRGYATFLFRTDSTSARLYSFATDPQYRRQGIALRLLRAGEKIAKQRHCLSLRLETRLDNVAMQRLVTQCGYQSFGRLAHYYEDEMDALRFQKFLRVKK